MDFREQLNKVLAEYADEVDRASEECIKKIARTGAKELKKVSPRKSGKYAGGWTAKVERGRMAVSAVIYNKAKPGLAHLLEHGHVIRNGTGRTYGRTAPDVHIEPVEAEISESFEKQLETMLR